MDERIARLRTHRKNIGRYRRLLKTNLTEVERRYLEGRLSEERYAIQMLSNCIGPQNPLVNEPTGPTGL
jgi:hypothetical protein